jgi:hypothetical protein
LVVVVVVGWVVRLTKRFGWWMYWNPIVPGKVGDVLYFSAEYELSFHCFKTPADVYDRSYAKRRERALNSIFDLIDGKSHVAARVALGRQFRVSREL